MDLKEERPLSELTFEDWMEAVDIEVVNVAGIETDDLEDQTYRDWFDSGMTPHEAALQALENCGFGE
jgi:hypothetical protein